MVKNSTNLQGDDDLNIVGELRELKNLKPKQDFIVKTEELLRMKAKKLLEENIHSKKTK